jgi:hypothetical protein
MRAEISRMREALASYIEATYHLSNPKLVDLRRRLLMRIPMKADSCSD